MTSKYSSSIRNDQIALHLKPQKQMNKAFLFRKEINGKQALKRGFRKQYRSSLLSLETDYTFLQSRRYLSHMKKFKSARPLTLHVNYPCKIPQHLFSKIFHALKYLKGLTVIHLQITFPALYGDLDLDSLTQALPTMNDLFRVQIKFSIHFSGLSGIYWLEQVEFFKSLRKLERLTSVSLTLSRNIVLFELLRVILPLNKSKSLTKFSLTLQEYSQWRDWELSFLFKFLKEIKPLKSSEILFKKYNPPSYKHVKEFIPLLEEAGQKGAIKITFENCAPKFRDYQRLLFIESVKKIKSPHKVEVIFTPFPSRGCITSGIFAFLKRL